MSKWILLIYRKKWVCELFLIKLYFKATLGKQGTFNQGLSPEPFAIRHKLKSIHPCEGRGMTEEAPVMGVEEQPQV
ncbi:hypothetical protein [Neobacillus drentensis]|uniref:hypothetical protein n=1 Tax=Neobacillus drentensis TaxID=220684 RepID=UPI002FFF09D4